MKNVTNALANHLNTEKNFVSCDLFEVKLTNGNTYYYCNTDMDLTYDGKTYIHSGPLLKRQQTKLNDRVVVDTMSITISADSSDVIEGVGFMYAAHNGILDRAVVTLLRAFFSGGNVIGAVPLFSGIAEIKKCGGLGLELSVKAKTNGLSQEFPVRKYYPQGTYSTTNGSVTASGSNDDYCVITPFVPQKEVLL